MSKPNDGGPAFPRVPWDVNDYTGDGSPGMSLRDYFAGQALAGMLADSTRQGSLGNYAEDAYKFADAMLAEREKERV